MKVLLDMPKEVLENPHGYCCYTLAEHIKNQPKIALNDVLNKIKTEIGDTGAYEQETNGKTEFLKGINYCLGIIDTYMVDSESNLVVDIFGELHEIKSEEEPKQIAYDVGGHTYGVIGGDEIMKKFEV